MTPVESTKKLVKKRPAETTGGTLSVVVGAVLSLFKVDLEPTQVAAIVVLLGLVPGAVTWWRSRS